MSNVNGRKVKLATMHANMFIPGVGDIRKELSSTDDGINKAVGMVIDEPFVVVTLKDKGGNVLTVPVPLTNFSHMVLVKE
jgi:hypothetical protein